MSKPGAAGNAAVERWHEVESFPLASSDDIRAGLQRT